MSRNTHVAILWLVFCPSGAVGGTRRLRAQQLGTLQESTERSSAGTSGVFYNYENHGEDWKDGQCASRDRQSPIDFPLSAPWAAVSSESFHYDYAAIEGAVNVQNTGHGIAVELANQGYGGVWYRNSFYALTSVTFHLHSEHTFHGESKPMEIHIVHKSAERANALILALPFGFYADPGITYSAVGSQVMCAGPGTVTRTYPTFLPEQCKALCTGMAACLAYVTAETSDCPMCVVYENTDCSQRFQLKSPCTGNLTAHNKNIVDRQGFFPLGAGRCTPTPNLVQLGTVVQSDAAVALWDCKMKCTLQPECSYISVSSGGGCTWYRGAPKLCDSRPEGQEEWKTFQKVEADMNIPLALLLGPDDLPEMGVKRAREMPFPADILAQLVGGGRFFEYEGSLTVPPCTEAATWLVRREPLHFSQNQHDILHDKIYEATSESGNYRATMPRMGRDIRVVDAVSGPPPQKEQGGPGGPSFGPSPGPAPAPAPPPAPVSAPSPGGPPPYVPMRADSQSEEAVAWAHQAHQMAETIGHTLKAYPPPGFSAADLPLMPGSQLASPFGAAAGAAFGPAVLAPPGLAAGGAMTGLLFLAHPNTARGKAPLLRPEVEATGAVLAESRALADRPHDTANSAALA